MNKSTFSLKKPPTNMGLFTPTTGTFYGLNGITETVVNISIDKLKHYSSHPFKLYEGERLGDMIESIKANGILIPLLVRPLSPADNAPPYEYEVLAGHNRLESGKIAGLTEVPCIVKEGLMDEEAHLIVTESNLVQRSFADLSHSERAVALAAHYAAIKHQGKRTDLIRQVEVLLTNGDTADSESNPSASSEGKSIEQTSEKYGLSKSSVARYIRIHGLIPGFKELLDSEAIPFRVGVALSYLDDERQQTVLSQMQRYDVSPNIKQAEQIKQLAAGTADDDSDKFLLGCADILLGRNAYKKEQKPKKVISLKLDRSAVKNYIPKDATDEMVQQTVLEALEFYHLHNERIKHSHES